MSQVHYESVRNSVRDCVESVQFGGSIVVVKTPGTHRVFKQVVFPRQTHYAQDEETTYVEGATEHEIIRVLHAGELTNTKWITIWHPPEYDYESVRLYHEEGLSESPIIMKSEPEFPVQGDEQILFVRRHVEVTDAFPEVYVVDATEGLGAEPLIRQLLSAWP